MTGRQNYKDHFALRDASKSKARADDDGERIVREADAGVLYTKEGTTAEVVVCELCSPSRCTQ